MMLSVLVLICTLGAADCTRETAEDSFYGEPAATPMQCFMNGAVAATRMPEARLEGHRVVVRCLEQEEEEMAKLDRLGLYLPSLARADG